MFILADQYITAPPYMKLESNFVDFLKEKGL
jgi:hypothetical protein